MTVISSWPRCRQAFATLPFEGLRSLVPSDRLASSELEFSLQAPTDVERDVRLVTAVVAVLAWYTGNENIGIAAASANTIRPLCISAHTNLRIQDLVDRLRTALADTLGLTPDDDIEALQSGDVLDGSPAVGVLLQFGGEPDSRVKRDVTLHYDSPRRSLVASYDARLLRAEIVSGFLRHIRFALASIEADRCATLGTTQYVDDEEKENLRRLGIGDQPEIFGLLGDYLSKACAQSSSDIVVEFEAQSWTLADLLGRADQMITGLGTRAYKGARLGIGLRPGLDQIAALLTALRAGAVIVPMDTTLPASRLAAIVADSDLSAIITEESLSAHFGNSELLLINRLPSAPAEMPLWPNGMPTADCPLYLLFTSGSTGRPKGVLVPHRTLGNLVTWENARRPTRGKRTLGRTSIAFDVGLQEVFATILFGGTLVIANERERADIGELAKLLSQHRIARLYLPPVALHQMAESNGDDFAELNCLEHVIVAGEQLRISKGIRRFFRATRSRLINQYGPTETHVATEAELDPAPLRWPDLPSIGRPISGVNVHVVDSTGSPTPFLVPGEVVIGGIAPALGYVTESDVAHARFVLDRGSRLTYRTGDRARWRLDGTLEFLGRADDQVKIRGYRVELTDLEVNAAFLPGVRQAAAKFWEADPRSGLALYLLLDVDSAPSLRELREALRERVPEYMVPPLGAIFSLDAFPLSLSGKVDRSKLPEPQAQVTSGESVLDVGGRLRAIWARRLGLLRFDLNDDFLDLGGDSLLAIQTVSEVNDAFRIGIPVSMLLRGTTLRNFIEVVENQIAARAPHEDDHVHSVPRRDSGTSTPTKRFSARATSVVFPCGKMLTPSPSETRHLWTEIYGQRAYCPGAIRFNAGDVIVDVGANVGVFSRFALDMTGGCRLIAIEPAVELFECLQRNIIDSKSQITLMKFGCGRIDSEKTFSYFPQVPAMSSFDPDETRDRALLEKLLANDPIWVEANNELQKASYLESAFEVECHASPVRRLSSIFPQLAVSGIDLLKIDVQRGEDDVIAGLDESDWPKIRQIVIEMQDYRGAVLRMVDLCRSHGFVVEVATIPLHKSTDVRFVYAWRR